MGCGAKKSEEKSGIPAQQNSGERREPTPILFYNSTQYPQYQMETVDNFENAINKSNKGKSLVTLIFLSQSEVKKP